MAQQTRKVRLKIPDDITEATHNPTTVTLRWTSHHPAARPGSGVLVSQDGDILDGPSFRALRDTLGAHITTKDPTTICRALGLPIGEPGIGS